MTLTNDTNQIKREKSTIHHARKIPMDTHFNNLF